MLRTRSQYDFAGLSIFVHMYHIPVLKEPLSSMRFMSNESASHIGNLHTRQGLPHSYVLWGDELIRKETLFSRTWEPMLREPREAEPDETDVCLTSMGSITWYLVLSADESGR